MNILKRIGKFLRRRFLGLFYYTPINLSEEREYDDKHPNDQYIRLSHVGVPKTNWLVYPMHYRHPSRIVCLFVDKVIPNFLTFYCLKKVWKACLFAYDHFMYTELYFCTFSWYLLYEDESIPFDFNVDDADIWVQFQPLDFSTDGIYFTSIPMSSNMDQKPTLRSISPAPREIQNEFRPSLKVPPRYFHPKWFSSSDTFGDTDTWFNLKEPQHLRCIESPWDLPPKM